MNYLRYLSVFFLFVTTEAFGGELTRDEQLVLACYRVDIEAVVKLLRDGANPNATLGKIDRALLKDHWSARRYSGFQWTPLIALVHSSPYPDPPADEVFDSSNDAEVTRVMMRIPERAIEKRRSQTLAIMYMLISHKADINARDLGGATPLFTAVDHKKLELAKGLLAFDPDVNIATNNITIDGPTGMTPLHRAYWSKELSRLLLQKGANPSSMNSWQETPKVPK